MAGLNTEQLTAKLLEHIADASAHIVGGEANIQDLTSEWADIANLLVDSVLAKEIYADLIDADNLTARNALINFIQCIDLVANSLHVDVASVQKLYADCVTTDELNATIANLDTLFAEYIRAQDIVSGTISVEQILGSMATFLTIVSNSVTADDVTAFTITSDHITISDAFIKDAMIDEITASKIVSGIINTSNVSIGSADGHLVIADETIQISDDTNVRVQIGRDASDDFNMYVWDDAGNLMWNALGITSDAIKSAIIVDGMVAENANISASKIDIASVVRSINDGYTTIDSSKITVDSDNQTLSLWFSTMNEWKSDIASGTEGLQTQINVINGSLNTFITATEFENIADRIESVENNYSALYQDVSGFKTDVSQSYAKKEDTITTADYEADLGVVRDDIIDIRSTFTTTANVNSSIEQKAGEILSTVSQTYSTLDEASSLANRITTAESSINQKADEILSTVSSTYSSKLDLTNLSDRVNSAESSILQNATSIDSKVSKDGVISEINQSAEAVTINADKLNINGVVTANSYFKILADGSMECTNGRFNGYINATSGVVGGWTVTSTDMYNDNGSSCAGISKAGTAPAFWAGSTYAGRNTAPFRVLHDGTVNCKALRSMANDGSANTNILAGYLETYGPFSGTLHGNSWTYLPSIVCRDSASHYAEYSAHGLKYSQRSGEYYVSSMDYMGVYTPQVRVLTNGDYNNLSVLITKVTYLENNGCGMIEFYSDDGRRNHGNIRAKQAGGENRLNIWSPGHVTVEPMSANGQGWFSVTGNVVYSNSCFQFSSRKYKRNIQPITEEYADRILDMVPVSFDYINTGKPSEGFIAEDVAVIYPNLIQYDKGEINGLNYVGFIPYLTKKIQMMDAKIKELEACIIQQPLDPS